MKQKGIWLLAAELTLICILVGCAPSDKEKLIILEEGMTNEKVLEILGKPIEREAKGNVEWVLYEITPVNDPNVFVGIRWRPDSECFGFGGIRWKHNSNCFTPFLIQDGKLVGWGKSFWMGKAKRFNVKIDQTIKQK